MKKEFTRIFLILIVICFLSFSPFFTSFALDGAQYFGIDDIPWNWKELRSEELGIKINYPDNYRAENVSVKFDDGEIIKQIHIYPSFWPRQHDKTKDIVVFKKKVSSDFDLKYYADNWEMGDCVGCFHKNEEVGSGGVRWTRVTYGGEAGYSQTYLLVSRGYLYSISSGVLDEQNTHVFSKIVYSFGLIETGGNSPFCNRYVEFSERILQSIEDSYTRSDIEGGSTIISSFNWRRAGEEPIVSYPVIRGVKAVYDYPQDYESIYNSNLESIARVINGEARSLGFSNDDLNTNSFRDSGLSEEYSFYRDKSLYKVVLRLEPGVNAPGYTTVTVTCGKALDNFDKIYDAIIEKEKLREGDRINVVEVSPGGKIFAITGSNINIADYYYFDGERFEKISEDSYPVRCDVLESREIGEGMRCVDDGNIRISTINNSQNTNTNNLTRDDNNPFNSFLVRYEPGFSFWLVFNDLPMAEKILMLFAVFFVGYLIGIVPFILIKVFILGNVSGDSRPLFGAGYGLLVAFLLFQDFWPAYIIMGVLFGAIGYMEGDRDSVKKYLVGWFTESLRK